MRAQLQILATVGIPTPPSWVEGWSTWNQNLQIFELWMKIVNEERKRIERRNETLVQEIFREKVKESYWLRLEVSEPSSFYSYPHFVPLL